MTSHPTLRINGDRLWTRLMDMAQIGATAKGGVNRVALSDEDRIGRDLFIQWCEAAGCTVSVDQIGNIFARRPGKNNDAPAVMAGSHLDSQPTGGKYDGVYGVLAALEVIETLNDYNIETDVPIEIVNWTNEEGARFAPAMLASGVFCGEFSLEYGLTREDRSGLTIRDELKRIGYAGAEKIGQRNYKATFEIHIEQGPILEAEGKAVGIVTGVQAMRWYNITIPGKESHAGTTPMERRRDPVQAALPIWSQVFDVAAEHAPDSRVTIGEIYASPASINTVPGSLFFTLDMRHPSEESLLNMDNSVRQIVEEIVAASGLEVNFEEIWYSPAVTFDPACIDSVRRAVETTGVSAMEIVSGAGHDAVYISRVAPTSMIFVPCADGLSHNELESAEKHDLVDGCNVLLHAMLDQAIVDS